MTRTTKYEKSGEGAGPPSAAPRPAPHEFWRTFDAESFDTVRRLEVACCVGMISTDDLLWRKAIAGDPACAVAVAFRMTVPAEISYAVDARMSILLNAALAGSDGCALVLAHMLRRMPIEPRLRGRLATSWLVGNLQRMGISSNHGIASRRRRGSVADGGDLERGA
jgi:hypothetical protein